ncbi:protein SMAX1-LIKE 3 [Senna tora]|uniref:Protein SMAX1-LIKE 3 n=1 Tax=Senna tora TaxID=362788 RepID=A0A834VXX5_9FABA|nr:protein SMAX1-LIKE 3 [Senna tora]
MERVVNTSVEVVCFRNIISRKDQQVELRKIVGARGRGVVLYLGDLEWLVEMWAMNSCYYNHMVMEVKRMPPKRTRGQPVIDTPPPISDGIPPNSGAPAISDAPPISDAIPPNSGAPPISPEGSIPANTQADHELNKDWMVDVICK